MKTFAEGRLTLRKGDCLAIMDAMASNSVDSVVCDPPYHLLSTVKRFGGKNAAPAQHGTDGAFARASKGFMGKEWDGGDIAFRPETWAKVLRVLKPGGHLVAFSAPKCSHRMVCAIEDAGFEIRDGLMWMFGTGFPKSHDVSKGIDKSGGVDTSWFGPWLREHREATGISQKDLAERGGFYKNVNHGGLVANWELGYGEPTAEQFNEVCVLLNLPFKPIDVVKREVIGQRKVSRGVAFSSDGADTLDITLPATDAAREWSGWGTALKPAYEPICLARKPLVGTVAANVLAHGVGAINIDATRVATSDALGGGMVSMGRPKVSEGWDRPWMHDADVTERKKGESAIKVARAEALGRWPANVVHDGSDEVVAAFPETTSGDHKQYRQNVKGWKNSCDVNTFENKGDSGSASRFFYSAKASKHDRAGSKHPTVKPISLMRWLCRLVTPKGGTILDPFAGSGTTGAAAHLEGFRAILCEQDETYQDDIVNRLQEFSNDTPDPIIDPTDLTQCTSYEDQE